MTITGIYYPLDIEVNNDHHGDLLPLGHLGCPSRAFTTPWVKAEILMATILKAAFQLRVFHTCVHARKS